MLTTTAARTPRRLPWILLGAGLALAAETGAGIAVAAAVSVREATSDVRSVPAPQSVRLRTAPGWEVGTCLRRRGPVPCSAGHDAEVVAVVPAADDRRDARRRWGANASCAREVGAVVAAGDFAPDTVTYASAYPGGELSATDARVFCLLVAEDRSPMRGSWTAGDLEGPRRPEPFE